MFLFFQNFFIFWAAVVIPVVGSCLTLPYGEVEFQGHRCLVVSPPGLAEDAPVILALHGSLGNAEESFGYFYPPEDAPAALWVFPDGPLDERQAHVPAPLHAWYDRFTHSYRDMLKSREYLLALLDHFARYSPEGGGEPLARPRPVIVMGESQGGVMTFETGLNYPGRVLGLVSVCGFIEYPEGTLAHVVAPKDTPILMLNGKMDPVVQIEDAQGTAAALRKKGYRPQLRQYEAGHRITQGMKNAIRDFLERAIHGKDPNGPRTGRAMEKPGLERPSEPSRLL